MVSILLFLACPPKAPPPGSLDISAAVDVGGVGGNAIFLPVPVPIGQGHPFSGAPRTEGQHALLTGEAILAELQAINTPDQAALDAALTQADAARDALATAAEDTDLKCIADARYGDVMRVMGTLTTQLQSPQLTAADHEEWSRITEQSNLAFVSSALAAYDSVMARCDRDGAWYRHAADGRNALMAGHN